MVRPIRKETSIKELLERYPQSKTVLERFGIASDTKATLESAAGQKGIPTEDLISALEEAGKAPAAANRLRDDGTLADPDAFINYIESRYHTFMRHQLWRLEELLDSAIQKHGLRHGEMLGALQAVFVSFKTEIEEHMRIEEQILFPRISVIGQYKAGQSSASSGQWSPTDVSAIHQMKHEHKLAETTVEEIRALTGDYTLPDDADEDLIALFEGLKEMEANLSEHIDLENDYLWPVVHRKPHIEADLPVKTEPAAVPDNICPRTGQPCEAGSHARCDRFWSCIDEALSSLPSQEP